MPPVKGSILANHHPRNKFTLLVPGLPALTIIEISGLEQETEAVEMPDRTMASGGVAKSLEFTVTTPGHHHVEQAAWEAWHVEGKDPVLPSYKKACVLSSISLDGKVTKSWFLSGVFVKKYSLESFDMKNAGELVTVAHLCSCDQLTPGAVAKAA